MSGKDTTFFRLQSLSLRRKFIEEYENNSENGRMVSCDGSGDSNDMGNNFRRCY